MLKGDKRLAQVGWAHYTREYELCWKYNAQKMAPSMQFATQYNGKLDEMMETEEHLLECELKVFKAEASHV